LENQIDVKLVSLSKMGTSFGASDAAPATSSDRAPLLAGDDAASSGANRADGFRALSTEIRGLLTRLAAANDGMAEYAANQSQSAAVHHTLQRHRDILQDYRQEFNKTRANIEGLIEREDLMNSVHKEINDFGRGT